MKNNSSPANSDCEVDGIGRIAVVTKQVTEAETKLRMTTNFLQLPDGNELTAQDATSPGGATPKYPRYSKRTPHEQSADIGTLQKN